jgi:hypothetical protein
VPIVSTITVKNKKGMKYPSITFLLFKKKYNEKSKAIISKDSETAAGINY